LDLGARKHAGKTVASRSPKDSGNGPSPHEEPEMSQLPLRPDRAAGSVGARKVVTAACLSVLLGIGAAARAEQTQITIYSSAAPGAVPAGSYQLAPGQRGPDPASIPGYAIVRAARTIALKEGLNHIEVGDVAAYIDPTTVSFESLTAPETTRVVEQSFKFDVVNVERLLERYIGHTITVDPASTADAPPLTGRLLSIEGGLVLASEGGDLHAVSNYRAVHFPNLPGNLITRPTLVWDVVAQQADEHDTRVSYETRGMTWWADYNLLFSAGRDQQNGTIGIAAWASILNASGASYPDATIKLIAGDVHRAARTPRPMGRMMSQAALEQADAGFQERSFSELHLYTLGRSASLDENSTIQLALFPRVENVPAEKQLIYEPLQGRYPTLPTPITDRTFGPPATDKVDNYLRFVNDERYGLGMPLPAGRVRVSQVDGADGSPELIGEDLIDHTPKGEAVLLDLGSAFDVVGERRQVAFALDRESRHIDETVEIVLRNHKNQAVQVLVKEKLFRWPDNEVVDSNHRYERIDASSIQFPTRVAANGEETVRYRVRYSW
jgi:hypothetical protein